MTYNLKRSLAGLALACAVASAVALTLSLARGEDAGLTLACSECTYCDEGACTPEERKESDPNDCSRGIDEANQETCDGAVRK